MQNGLKVLVLDEEARSMIMMVMMMMMMMKMMVVMMMMEKISGVAQFGRRPIFPW